MNLWDRDLLDKYNILDWGYTEELEPRSFDHFQEWVEKGNHGTLGYLADHRKEARSHLHHVLPEAQSAVSFLFSYHPEKLALEEFYQSRASNGLKVASYVLGTEGRDYHLVLHKALIELGEELKKTYPDLEYRPVLDIQPVLERDLAYRAGLGWFGKNSMLINTKHGSFFLIGSLLLNKTLPLENAAVVDTDHCGQCRKCINACPTDAIDGENRQLIANRCLSTFTIELFKEGPQPPKGFESASGEIFGCDICQDVCPWNERPVRQGLKASDRETFLKNNKLILEWFMTEPLEKIKAALLDLSNNKFAKIFAETPLGRTGRRGLLKNLQLWKKP